MKTSKLLFGMLIMLSVFLFTLSCKDSTDPGNNNGNEYTYSVPEQVNDGWETASLADAGMNPLPLIIMMNELLNREDHQVHGILIVKNGKLVFEEYFSGEDLDISSGPQYVHRDFDRNTLHYLASVNKSFTSALVGIAVDRGLITGVDEKLFSFFPEYADLNNEEKDKITVAHTLAMASGIPWDESTPYSDPRNDMRQMFMSNDPIRYVLAKPLFATPGAQFHYNSGTTCVLGEIVKKQSELSLKTFAERYLFSPLGISDYQWQMLPNNVTLASGGLYLRPRDMAKFGQLYLQKGIWNGDRVISREWVEASAQESIALPSSKNPWPGFAYGYGYQWWLGNYNTGNTHTCFAAGWGGQYIFVLPDPEMVVVITAGAYEAGDYDMFYRIVNDYILGSVL